MKEFWSICHLIIDELDLDSGLSKSKKIIEVIDGGTLSFRSLLIISYCYTSVTIHFVTDVFS